MSVPIAIIIIHTNCRVDVETYSAISICKVMEISVKQIFCSTMVRTIISQSCVMWSTLYFATNMLIATNIFLLWFNSRNCPMKGMIVTVVPLAWSIRIKTSCWHTDRYFEISNFNRFSRNIKIDLTVYIEKMVSYVSINCFLYA